MKIKSLVPIAVLCGLVSSEMQAQRYALNGVVSAQSGAVRYASVTFIDQSDTARKVTVLSDTLGRYAVDVVTAVEGQSVHPTHFALDQNYPNPFSSATAIPYHLAAPAEVTITIYDILGREVRKNSMGRQSIGSYGMVWDGRNQRGERVPKGVYFCQLEAGGERHVKKMMYQFGSSAPSVTFPRGTVSFKRDDVPAGAAVLGGKFSVRVENTDSTFPAIMPQRFENIPVLSNATLDLTVSTNGTFPDPTAVLVYPDSARQAIRGFGAANIIGWRPDMTAVQVQKAFGAAPGEIGFSIMRLRVPYEGTDAAFSLQVASAKLAQSLGAIVFASPWTPPPSMKTNNNIVGGMLRESSYGDYAAHLKHFVDYMAANGAPLYAISLQNEPDATVTYESCSWNATQYLNFVKNNAASIGVRILMPESLNFNHKFSDETLNDPAAAANVAIIGGHLYGGGLSTYPLASSKGKDLWMTEYLDLDTSWTAVLGTGRQMSDCMKAGMNAYVWWYLVRYYGPMNESGVVTKRGYVMSQFARFIRPGFTRVASNDRTTGSVVDVTAYRSGRKLVVVAINRGTSPVQQQFVLWNGSAGTLAPYVTTSTKNVEPQTAATYKNGTFTYSLAPSSITTFVIN